MPALTPEQEQAVERRSGSLLLAAGAGSGKTSVLVERFVRAVREDGAAPGRMLVITFTERACGELRERIRARLLELGERDAAREAEEAFLSTFHGFCARLLRTHPLQAGVDPSFRVLEEGLASRLRQLAFRDALSFFQQGEPPDRVDLVAAYGVDALQRIVLGAHSQLRSLGQTNPRLANPGEGSVGGRAIPADGALGELDREAIAACRLIDELLRRFASAYEERKRGRGALDFDDLELRARDLLRERREIRDVWVERFAMLMVDEFQDTNPRQLELLELLQRDNLFTVGDELQSIYGFRHSDVSLFRARRERLHRDGGVLALTNNFRSAPPILAAVERVFAQRLGPTHTPLVAAREPHPVEQPIVELLLTDTRGWGTSQDAIPERGSAWRIAEARALAQRIAALVREGSAAPGEVVVLLRALSDLPLYESALRAAGISTLSGVGDFWGHRQVEDLIAYLRALCNPLDELALYGTLASPLVGVSSDGLALIARASQRCKEGVWRTIERACEEVDASLPALDAERLRRFRSWFTSERPRAALHPLAELVRRVLDWSGYERHVLSLQWGEHHLANVHKLLRLVRSFEAEEGRDLRGFLDHVAHLGGMLGAREAHAQPPHAQADAVRLLSIHSAKGLEFPVVCVADLGRAPKLGVPDLLVHPDGRLGLRLATLGDPELKPALCFEPLRDAMQAAQQQEEDRILYVAMTRAQERLLLSGALDFARLPAPRQGSPPIAWVAPALVPDVHSLLEGGEAHATVALDDTLSVRCLLNRPTDAPPPDDASPTTVDCGHSQDSDARIQVLRRSTPRRPITTLIAAGREPAIAPATEQLPLEDPDSTISYSALAELERCGYRHYLERVLGMGESPGSHGERVDSGVGARIRGVLVHLLLERMDFARPESPSEEYVARVARAAGVRLSRAERAELCELVATALDSDLARRIALGRDVHRELPFSFSLAPELPLVTGSIDLLAREPGGGALVVDYKSDRVSPDENLERLVGDRYELQRSIYALAVLEQGTERVEVAHWFLERSHEPVVVCHAADEREVLRERLLARMLALREKGFSVAPSPHRGLCLGCPGRGTLCSWPEAHTLREPPSGGPHRGQPSPGEPHPGEPSPAEPSPRQGDPARAATLSL